MSNSLTISGAGANIIGNVGSAGKNCTFTPYLSSTFGGNVSSAIISGANVANLNSQSAYTVMAWAYQDAEATQPSYGTIAIAGDNFHFAYNDNGYLLSQIRPGGAAVTINTVTNALDTNYRYLRKGTWSHVAFAWDGSDGEGGTDYIYVNGKLWASGAVGTAATVTENAKLIMLAKEPNNDALNGSVTDVKAFNTKLTQSQIQLMASEPYAPLSLISSVSSSCQLWYKLDDADAVTPIDSATGNDGLSNSLPNTLTKDYGTWSVNQVGSGTNTGVVRISGGTFDLKASSYMEFNGSDAKIGFTTPAFANGVDLNDLDATIGAWAKHDTIEQYEALICLGTFDFEIAPDSNDKMGIWVNNAFAFTPEYDIPIGEWHHYVATKNGDVYTLYVDGVAQGSGTDTDNETIAATSTIGNNNSTSFFDGQIREAFMYDYVLTAEMVASLYKGQLPTTPTHWWKLDDGVGATTAVDSGTGKRNTPTATLYDGAITNATGVNPTYTALEDFQLKAKGSLSAPKGILDLDGSFDIHNVSGTFTHNNGTVEFGGGNITGTTGITFYNITGNKLGGGTQNWYFKNSPMTIENTFTCVSGSSCRLKSDTTVAHDSLTFGTATSSATLYLENPPSHGDPYSITFDDNDGTKAAVRLLGASSLYPAIVDTTSGGAANIKWGNDLSTFSNVEIGNINFGSVATDGKVHLKVTGDLSTSDFTVSSTDIFEMASGTRASFSDNFIGNGHLIFNDALIFETKDWKPLYGNDAVVYYGTEDNPTTLIQGGSDNKPLQQGVNRFTEGKLNMVIRNIGGDGKPTSSDDFAGWSGSLVNASGNKYGIGDVTVLGPTWNLNDFNIGTSGGTDVSPIVNLNVPADSTLSGTSSQINLAGNFNFGGGFIGNGALDFDGVDGKMSTSANFDEIASTNKFTLEAWAKTSDTTGGAYLISRGSGWGAGAINLYYNDDGDIRISCYDMVVTNPQGADIYLDGGAGIGYDASQEDGKWHYYVGTYDGTKLKLYIDGELKGTGDSTSTINTQSNGAFLGARNVAGPFDGKMARASVWDAALTQAEIRQMMFQNWALVSGSTTDQTNCIAWYQFDNVDGNTSIEDMSGSGSTGTREGGATYAGMGTFAYGTSMVNFASGSSGRIKWGVGNALDMWDLKISDTATVLVEGRSGDTGSGYFDIYNDIWVSGNFDSGPQSSSKYWRQGKGSDGGDHLYVANDGNTPNERLDGFLYMNINPEGGSNPTYFPARNSEATSLKLKNIQVTEPNCEIIQTADLEINAANKGLQIGNLGTWETGGYDIDNLTFVRASNDTNPGKFIMGAGTNINFQGATSWGTQFINGTLIASGEAAGIFDGTDDYIKGPNITWGDTASVAGWMRLSDPDQAGNPVPFSADYGFGVQSYYNNERMRFSIRLDGESSQVKDWTHGWSDSVLTQWHHVGWTFDGAIWRCYVDGVQVTTDTTNMPGTLKEPGANVNIGVNGNGATSWFGGGLADYRLYPSTVLDADDMATLASENPATSVSGAYADPDNDLGAGLWYKLGATASGTLDLTDYAGSNNGTNYGGTKSGFVKLGRYTGNTSNYAPILTGSSGSGVDQTASTTFTNTYISGSEDALVVAGAGPFTTKGTVVLD